MCALCHHAANEPVGKPQKQPISWILQKRPISLIYYCIPAQHLTILYRKRFDYVAIDFSYLYLYRLILKYIPTACYFEVSREHQHSA